MRKAPSLKSYINNWFLPTLFTEEEMMHMKKPQAHAVAPKAKTNPTKPRTRAADPGADALHRIVAILRPLSAERRAQVLRAVTSYYGSGGNESGSSGS